MPYDGDHPVEPAPAWTDDLDALRAMAALLAAELRCSPADLDANRDGRLAPGQRRRLIRRLALHVAGLALGGVVVLVLLVVPLLVSLINVVIGAPRTGDSLFVLVFFGPFTVLLLMGMVVGLTHSQARDLLGVLRAPAPVRRVVGEVLDGDGGGREVRLGTLTSALTARVDAALLAPGRYAAYHVGSPYDSPILLSAELLAAETPG
ncbi:hypothetical protein B0I32_114107 [Nonomuraea fuscirosea]|uniref:Uncharacterized protein n=1 Tax=Nonomuraea fuscirosea TaxID=1291556 RepID=A0A2T0MT23_9ACTN|nr:hypothetical protein [Nonomuraea fuscirosea]PRX61738.1 hypothetical protein B0I32_114107 [Nonomuraea fuscirosea]